MLEQTINSIGSLHKDTMVKAQIRLDSLTKPLGSLGRLESMVKQMAGITGELYPKMDKKAIVIMCADNGVVDEGVSSCPKSVTASVTRNFARGITGINVFAQQTGSDVVVVDIGVDDDIKDSRIIDRKIRRGTWNMAKGPAMTRKEARKAIEVGIEIVSDLKAKGIRLLATGEMGIGNTATSSAVSAVLTGTPLQYMVGKGSGLTQEGLSHKQYIIQKAIELNRPDPEDPMDVLSKVGGFDIAGLAGCFLGAASHRLPIFIDGFISAAAALVAVKIKPEVKDYIFPSHSSAEPGSKKIMEILGFEPMLNLEMRLGEGTGAALAFHLVDAAFAAYTKMGTFGDAEIDQYKPLE